MNRSALKAVLNPIRPLTPAEAGKRLRSAQRVLLVKPHHKIGDLMVSTSLIRNLRLTLPDARLVCIAGRYNAGAVLDNPDLDQVEVARMTGPGVLANIPLVLRLRRERFDVAMVLSTIDQSSTAIAITHLCKPGFVVGLDDARWGGVADIAYDCVVPASQDSRFNMVDYNLDLLEGLGIPVTTREHVLGVTPEQVRRGRAALDALGVRADLPVLGIQVGSSAEAARRQWPVEHYAVIARRAREAGWQVVLLGLPDDEASIERVQPQDGDRFPTLTRLPFATYKAVLRGLDCFLSHDGGPAHLVAGVGTPALLLYVAAPAWRWAPYGAHVHVLEDLVETPTPDAVWDLLGPLLREIKRTRGAAEVPGSTS